MDALHAALHWAPTHTSQAQRALPLSVTCVQAWLAGWGMTTAVSDGTVT